MSSAPAGAALAGRLRLPMLARPAPRFRPLPREPCGGFQPNIMRILLLCP